MTIRIWARHVLLFFSFGFALHASGLLLHEFGGHGFVMTVAGCGVSGWDLSYFGHGSIEGVDPCAIWTPLCLVVMLWSGIAVCLAAGLAAMRLAPRARTPIGRALWLTAAWILFVAQLRYAITGGFHRRFDPELTARWLDARGLGWLGWTVPLVPYLAAAFILPARAVAAFREHFGSTTRTRAAAQLALTVGAAGLVYALALNLEFAVRPSMVRAGLEEEARARARRVELAQAREVRRTGKSLTPERIGELEAAERPFPIDAVLYGIAAVGLGLALARKVSGADVGAGRSIDRRTVYAVHGAAVGLALVVALLRYVGGPPGF